jgi:hypothetical protein
MSELHSGVPHDLPEYVPNLTTSPPRTIRWRVQVFKDGWGWSWVHQCRSHYHSEHHGYESWAEAFRTACEHLRSCP